MDNTTRASLSDLLTNALKDNKTWRDLVEAAQVVLRVNVEDPIDQLARIRYVRRDMDPAILERTARQLGFDLTQDVLNLNSETLTKIVRRR